MKISSPDTEVNMNACDIEVCKENEYIQNESDL